MTKLALYEKKYMQKDKRKVNYFIEDYIYLRNFWVRLGISILILFNIALGAFKIISNEIIFPKTMGEFFDVYIQPYVMPWLILIVVYTLISTYASGKEYRKASNRYSEYKKLLRELEKYDSHQVNNEGDANEI